MKEAKAGTRGSCYGLTYDLGEHSASGVVSMAQMTSLQAGIFEAAA